MRKQFRKRDELFEDYYEAYMEYLRPYTDGNMDYTDYEEWQTRYEYLHGEKLDNIYKRYRDPNEGE